MFENQLNQKLNYYLPTPATNNYEFVKSIGKVLLNDKILKDNIIRKDYKTKSLLKLIDDKDFNDNLEWINFNDFKKYINLIINDEENINLKDEAKFNILIKILDLNADEIKDEENAISLVLAIMIL